MRPEHGTVGKLWPVAMLRGGLRDALDLVFPPAALEGAGAQPRTTGLSAEAWGRVTFLDNPVCDGCGAPFEYDLGAGVRCPACETEPHRFARARAACVYDDASRDLVLQFKHADRTELARLFALWLSRAAKDLLQDAEAVVPVPLHRLRLLNRRYNQAAEIARPLAAGAGVAYLPDVLHRRKSGSQAGKSGAGRRRGVAGAFHVPPGARRRIEGKRVLLIDDVLTTGATADACARTLLGAGACAVDVAIVARVRDRRLVAI